jgi:hypothetical protein
MSGTVMRLAILALSAALVSGCGGEGTRSRPPPRLPTAVARTLAASSDRLAASLERGDACSAGREAASLRESVRTLLADGRVPGPFRIPLLASVAEISTSIPHCLPPAQEDDQEGNGKHKGEGKNQGKNKGKHRGNGHGGKD